jgi:hypothetical protein
MEFALLLLLFFIASLVQRAAQKSRQGGGPRRRARVPRPERSGPRREAPQSLRELFEEVRRSMDEADRRARGELDEAPVDLLEPPESIDEEVVEERESLEAPEQVVNLEEQFVRRAERPVVDQDEGAEAIVQRRIQWAERQARGRTVADHRTYDAEIRKPAAPAAPARNRAAELRKMVIWREVLGPPVGLREDR